MFARWRQGKAAETKSRGGTMMAHIRTIRDLVIFLGDVLVRNDLVLQPLATEYRLSGWSCYRDCLKGDGNLLLVVTS